MEHWPRRAGELAAAGRTRQLGPSVRVELTTALAGRATISCGGIGDSSSRAAEPSREGSSQACHAPRPARTTGTRSWIGRTSSFAAQVMIVQLGTHLTAGRCPARPEPGEAEQPAVGEREVKRPLGLARVLRSLPLIPAVRQDQAAVTRPRDQPSVGRLLLESLGARALIIEKRDLSSSARCGTSPQRSSSIRLPSRS
jgi:hypothetical protein